VLRRRHGRPIGQLSMSRTPKDILAIGFQASARSESLEVAPTCLIAELAQLIDQIGHIGIAGVYQGRSLQPSAMGEANGSITVPWAPLFTMGVSVSVGPQARLALPGSAACSPDGRSVRPG
jgi:glutathione-independent formaldehyde dehydrogenase